MATNIGPKIGIDGEKQFRSELTSIGQQLRTLGTEMKAVTSSFDANDSSQKKLAAQSDVLTRRLILQEQQLAGIQKGLDYAKANYAENSDEVQKWQQALNNATTDLNKTKAGIKSLSDEAKNTGPISDFGKALKSGLATAAKAAAAATAAAAGAMVALVKSAVENYGEYEQLVGGVETLFKSSADTVQEYANNAYKTAGLSANEYMETVTSFSASLLQSMGNDTQAAAEKANRAITDMSDNANKMGTDMKSIQNAYQGFAKQNYTMLDNLKLGYGGTKEEMPTLSTPPRAIIPATPLRVMRTLWMPSIPCRRRWGSPAPRRWRPAPPFRGAWGRSSPHGKTLLLGWLTIMPIWIHWSQICWTALQRRETM